MGPFCLKSYGNENFFHNSNIDCHIENTNNQFLRKICNRRIGIRMGMISYDLPLKDDPKTGNWKNISLRKKCPNTELFLVRIFSYLD